MITSNEVDHMIQYEIDELSATFKQRQKLESKEWLKNNKML
ncbi:1832_t:CDS:2 [Gigaspora margarita]|uniref:1832_t:CDS:1 n=1 Tax=Gigaspora margarita TaxID=4874 RepID=A0ABN7UDR4_GIGMA|nr:1832_t:CDS:2 [Gigaspora margarita]